MHVVHIAFITTEAPQVNAFPTHPSDLQSRLLRAEARMARSESDAEYEANRQVVIYLRSLVAERGRYVQ